MSRLGRERSCVAGLGLADVAGDNPRTPEAGWLRQQLALIVIGAVLALGSLATAVAGLLAFPFDSADVLGYPVSGTVGSAVLTVCNLVILLVWAVAVGRVRAGRQFVERPWRIVALTAHIMSYAATLVAMFGALAASALAGWDSPSGVLFGLAFLLAIFGQILAGSQDLRDSGPPATVPTYLRRLNAVVQSKR